MRKLAFALACGLALTGAFSSPAHVAATSSQAKVAIIVGATQGTTSSYRADGDRIASVFSRYTSNVVKVYSPNATWANVQAAAQGASVLVYIGHGSGYPNPYVSYLQPNGDNGMGLNYSTGSKAKNDNYTQYYGENYMAQLGLAPNAVVLLWHLCYASGDSEWGQGKPSLSVAQTRIDGYASGFLRGNARAVIAEGVRDISSYAEDLFSTHQSILSMWQSAPSFHNNVSSWGSSRNAGFTSYMDPDLANPAPDGDPYYRSMVVQPGLSTDDVGGRPIIYDPTTFYTMTPLRVLDTRANNGISGRVKANVPGTFQVAGRGAIPAGATAVTGNLTVANPSSGWALYLGPQPLSAPFTSTINFSKGEIKGNSLTIGLGTDGTLSVTYMSNAGNTTDVVFDVTGYFLPNTSGARFHSITPTRLVDSRLGRGLSGPLVANQPSTFSVLGQAGIPSNAIAVTGNVTVADPTFGWAVYLGPNPDPNPSTSTVNFLTNQVKANSVTISLGSGGTLSATFMSHDGNTAELIFDVTGYYAPDSSGMRFTPLTPARLMDTRANNGLSGKFGSNNPRWLQITGRADIPSTAKAIAGNVTIVNESFAWAVYVGPDASASPSTSTINFVRGDIVGNGLVVAIQSGGTVGMTYMSIGGQTTDVILDVTGYYAP
jgi:hypothetical protein